MTTTRTGIDAATPLGATVVPGATTFRLHAPRAAAVHVVTDDALRDAATYVPSSADALFAVGDGTWGASLAGIAAGARYRYWIDGAGSSGWKRDPRAREIDPAVVGSDSDCVVRDPTTWHWHDAGWRRPADADLVLYQLHVGTWSAIGADGSDRRASIGRFVDLLDRLDDLVALGINAVQLLPIQEFHTPTSLGYNGVDLYSPETDYRVCDPDDLARRVARIDAMYAKQGSPPLAVGALASGADQLRCVIDLFHLNGIAVFFDVVYNHAGPGLDDQSLYFLDRRPMADPNDSLYFTDREWAGGKVFAYWNADVRRFLVDNALAWIDEFHVDGLRYDEVTVIDTHGGRGFAQQCTTEVRARRADVLQIAEYWGDDRALAVRPAPDGLGFDAAWADGLRVAIRAAIAAASNGRDASVDLADVAAALMPPAGFPGATGATGAIQSIEDHDVVYVGRSPRIARLADPADPHSWNACGRARVALGLLLAGPGIPQLFMGQEFLATEPWSDDVADHPGCLIDWTSIATDRAARDYLRFTGDAIRLRRSLRGLRGAGVRAWATNATDRALVVERWHDPVESVDDAVVVVFNLQDFARTDYVIGFPAEGTWRERFDSDWYDGAPNIATIGNLGQVIATSDRPWQRRPASASLTLPPNGWIAFTR